jgi:hypothetical protein
MYKLKKWSGDVHDTERLNKISSNGIYQEQPRKASSTFY